MLEKLVTAGERIANAAVARQADKLATSPAPPDVLIDPIPQGILLTGKNLRRRIITDPNLRNFAR